MESEKFNLIAMVCAKLEDIFLTTDAKNIREMEVENFLRRLGTEYADNKNYRVVCLVLKPVTENGDRIKEAISTLSYWSMYES